MMRKSFFTQGLLFILFFTSQVCAQNLPAGFTTNEIASGWDAPVGACFNKTGTMLFVWQKGGKVYVCNRNASTGVYTKQSTPVLDISAEVGDWRDHGLLGFALDPNFESTGLIYLMYVVDRHYLMKFGISGYSATTDDYFSATIGRITRYKTATSGGVLTATASSRSVLLGESKSTGIPILHESHGVGTLAFAADGTLLASAGDAASYNTTDSGSLAETYYVQAITDGIIRSNENKGAFRSQMINSLNGKILRIDPATGNGVSSNPYYSSSAPRAASSRVWAMGFRNPYRFCVKPGIGSLYPSVGDLGELYVADVGWNTYEELNIVRAPGQNCGWPLFEGIKAQANYMALSPLNLDELNPRYGVSGCTKRYFNFKELIKQAVPDNSTTIYNPCSSTTLITSPNPNRFVHRYPSLDWKHYTDSARVGVFTGTVLGVAQIGSAASGVTGTSFQGNSGVGGCIYTGSMFPPEYKNRFFMSDYGANWIKTVTMATSEDVSKVDHFASGGFAAVVCLVENPADGSMVLVDIGTNKIIRVSYGGNKFPVVKITSNKTYGTAPLAVNFTGNGSYDPEGSAVTYSWNFGDGTALNTTANPSHTFTTSNSQPKMFVVQLSVKDNQNQVSTDSIIISANNTPPVVNITSPVKNSNYRLGSDTSYSLKATVTDAQHTAGQLKYEWQTFLRHNNHQHPEAIDTNRNTTTRISRIGCNGDTYYFLVKLRVTDAAGLYTEDSSKIFPQCTGVVAASLYYADAVAYKDYNNVIWAMQSEINLSSFEIERSCDGVNFYSIAFVPAKRTEGMNLYEWHDEHPCNGNNYYRIKMVSIGTACMYSDVLPLYAKAKDTEALTARPVPFKNEFELGGTFTEAGAVMIRISDMQGRPVKVMSEKVRTGYNSFRIQDLETLSPGVYTAEIIQQNKRRVMKITKGN